MECPNLDNFSGQHHFCSLVNWESCMTAFDCITYPTLGYVGAFNFNNFLRLGDGNLEQSKMQRGGELLKFRFDRCIRNRDSISPRPGGMRTAEYRESKSEKEKLAIIMFKLIMSSKHLNQPWKQIKYNPKKSPTLVAACTFPKSVKLLLYN